MHVASLLLVIVGGIAFATPPVSPPAVGVLVRDGNAVCTGSVLAHGFVLTAAHCVRSDLARDPVRGFAFLSARYALDLPSGRVALRPIKIAPDSDLALFRILGPSPVAGLHLSGVPPGVGDALQYWGNPLALGILRIEGRVARLSVGDGGGPAGGAFVADLLVGGGASGSAVLNPEGRIVGVLVGYRQGPARGGMGASGGHFAFVVPLDVLQDFLYGRESGVYLTTP